MSIAQHNPQMEHIWFGGNIAHLRGRERCSDGGKEGRKEDTNGSASVEGGE